MKNKAIHIFLSIVKNIVFYLLILVALYLFVAVLFSILKTHPPELNCEKDKTFYVSSNGVHLDIIVPVEELDNQFKQQLDLQQGTKYVAFGWGDKGFYLKTPEWSDLTFSTAFKAVFLKSKSAMHVSCYKQVYQSWRKVDVCDVQMNTLTQYISNSFIKNENGDLLKLGIDGYSFNDRFFDAKGSFTLFYTCNVWTNTALKKSGVETSVWSPFDFGVLYHLSE